MTEKNTKATKEGTITLRQFKEDEKIHDLLYYGFKADKKLTDDSKATKTEYKKQFTAYMKKPAFKIKK